MIASLRLALVATVALGSAACASIAPGDYVVYRIGFAQTEAGSDCYDGEDPPADVVDDETTFYGGGTFVIFRGDDGYFLDDSSVLLAGTRSGGEFDFQGRSSDVYYQGDDRYEDRLDLRVVMTDKGNVVDGRSTRIVEQICSGIDCAVGYDQTCTQTTDFVGTRVKDADIEYTIRAD